MIDTTRGMVGLKWTTPDKRDVAAYKAQLDAMAAEYGWSTTFVGIVVAISFAAAARGAARRLIETVPVADYRETFARLLAEGEAAAANLPLDEAVSFVIAATSLMGAQLASDPDAKPHPEVTHPEVRTTS